MSQHKPAFHDHPVFGLAFRPLFLGAGILAVVALLLWLIMLHTGMGGTLPGGMLWWHMHEMIYGFAVAVALGFLLTAVQTWTGVPSIKQRPLMVLFLLWVLARVLMVIPMTAGWWLSAIIDLAFIPVGAFYMARCVLQVKQWRNFIFVPVLTLFTLANFAMHWGKLDANPILAINGAKAGVFLMVVLMTIIGGRIIPFFTANATGVPKTDALPWLDLTIVTGTIVTILLLFLGEITGIPTLTGLLSLALAALHVYRWSRWHFKATLRIPILWSLQISYLMIPLGFALFGLNQFTAAVPESNAIHAFTVGGIGLMILAMMTRVSLGHTGRPLKLAAIIPVAYVAVLLSGILRTLGDVVGLPATVVYDISGTAWIIGFGIFVVIYWPILTRPRIDGKPG